MEANPVPRQKGKYGHGIGHEESKNEALIFQDLDRDRERDQIYLFAMTF
jgi:hypothetical protein